MNRGRAMDGTPHFHDPEPQDGSGMRRPRLDVVDLVIDPIWHPISEVPEIDTRNLFLRPGRIIGVNGWIS